MYMYIYMYIYICKAVVLCKMSPHDFPFTITFFFERNPSIFFFCQDLFLQLHLILNTPMELVHLHHSLVAQRFSK